jgi:hypothetical protein
MLTLKVYPIVILSLLQIFLVALAYLYYWDVIVTDDSVLGTGKAVERLLLVVKGRIIATAVEIVKTLQVEIMNELTKSISNTLPYFL